MFLRTFSFRTIHVPNKFNSSFVIPTFRVEFAVHRNCSHFYHTSLQRKIGFYAGGKFQDGKY